MTKKIAKKKTPARKPVEVETTIGTDADLPTAMQYVDHVNDGEFGPETDEPADEMVMHIDEAIDELREQGLDGLAVILPLADPPANESQYAKVEVRLNKAEKHAFMSLRSGLRQSNARLSDGRPVWSSADVVRWLTQQVSAA